MKISTHMVEFVVRIVVKLHVYTVRGEGSSGEGNVFFRKKRLVGTRLGIEVCVCVCNEHRNDKCKDKQ